MKKVILLFAMMLAVGTVSAKKERLYASFGAINNANIASGNLSFTATSNANLVLFTFTSGELAEYSTLRFKITKVSTTSGAGNLYRLQFRNGSTELKTTDNYTTEDLTLDLSSLGITLNNVTDIRLLGPQYQTSVITMSVKDVYLEKSTDNECMSINTTINSSSSKTAPFVWELGGNNPTIYARFGTSIESNSTALFGSDNAGPTNGYYFDVTGYNYAIADLIAFTGGDVRYFNKEGETTTNATTYIALSGTQHITTIKGGSSNSSSKAITVNTIDFVKDFDATSTDNFSIAASSSSTVAYDRTFTPGQASTICLPFALSSTEVTATGGKFYAFESATSTSLKFSEVSETTAYTPYLFVAGTNTTPFSSLTNKEIVASEGANTTVTKNGFSFIGTLAKTDIPTGAYGFNGGDLKKAGTGVTINAFRGYFTGAFSESRSIDIDLGDGSVTGISKIQAETSNDTPIYNLNGQRVGTDYKGIVIQNGKKVIKK